MAGSLNPGRCRRVYGIAPPRIDHVLVHAEEVNEMTHFMQACFDFHLTEQVLTSEGHMMGAFLQRSGRPHDIAIIQGPNGAPPLLVLARRLGPRAAGGRHPRLQRDLDRHRPDPARITRQHDLLLRPDGHAQRGLHRRLPPTRLPVIAWTEDNLGRAIFYYEGRDNGRFLTVHT